MDTTTSKNAPWSHCFLASADPKVSAVAVVGRRHWIRPITQWCSRFETNKNTPELESLDSPPSAWPHQRRHRDQHQPFIFRCFFRPVFFTSNFVKFALPDAFWCSILAKKSAKALQKASKMTPKSHQKLIFFEFTEISENCTPPIQNHTFSLFGRRFLGSESKKNG